VQVLSGKGGVGKSSITTQLALSLSLAGKSVGILDIDLTGPSIPRLLGLENAKITQAPGGWLPCEVHQSQVLPPIPTAQNPNEKTADTNTPAALSTNNNPPQNGTDPPPIGSLHAISLALLLPSRTTAIIWRGPKKTAMVRQFLTSTLWPPTDYLLIDTPPGTSDEHISLVESLLTHSSPSQLAGAVIVTTPQAVAVADVRKEVNFCGKVGVRVLGVVENMSGFVCECCGVGANVFGRGGGEGMAGEFGMRFLGRVPLDGRWGRLVEEGVRPEYGVVENSEGGGGGEGGEKGRERDEGLLVDKYRSCSLCGVFEGITSELIGIVEGGGNGGSGEHT